MNAHQRRRFARQFPPGSVVTIPWGFSGYLTATVKSNDGRSAALNGVDNFGNTFFVRACAARLKQRPRPKVTS